MNPRDDRTASAPPGSADNGSGGLTRREALALPLAAAVLTSLAGCRPRDIDTTLGLDIVRPEDQLALRLDFENLVLVQHAHRTAELRRDGTSARLIITLPPQHRAEQTFSDSEEPCPLIASAQPGRLVLDMHPSVNAVELTIEALLNQANWRVVFDDAGKRSSELALPTGLLLAPEHNGVLRHAVAPQTYRHRTELWHTRLAGGDNETLRVRVNHAGASTGLENLKPALTDADRRKLDGKHVDARTLLLSPWGGWLDVRGSWPGDDDIERWEHRITQGRDQYVLVQGPTGYLYPFGHAAVRITVTERRTQDNGPAYLGRREFVAIKTPTVEYAPGSMPFRSLTALTTTTPPLRIQPSDTTFWLVASNGDDVRIRFEAKDRTNALSYFDAAAVFVADGETKQAACLYDTDQRANVGISAQPVAVAAPARDDDQSDTTLNLHSIRFFASLDACCDSGFICQTRFVDASVPALAPYVEADNNRALFVIEDPDDASNHGEVYASAYESDNRILSLSPGYEDRVGGLVTPRFRVDGLSRRDGAVANADAARNGEPVIPAGQFFEGSSLLGAFNLANLLGDGSSEDDKPSYMPKLIRSIKRNEKKDCPAPDDADEQTASDKEPPQSGGGATITLGLAWTFDIPDYEAGFVALDSIPGKAAQLKLEVTGKRAILDAECPTTETSSDDTDSPSEESSTENENQSPGPEFKVSAEVTNARLALELHDLGGIRIPIEKLAVSLAQAKKDKDDDNKAPDKEPADPDSGKTDPATDKGDKNNKDDRESALKPEIDFKLGNIEGWGVLGFVNPLMSLLSKVPDGLDFGDTPAPAPTAARLPDVGEADVSVTIGPIRLPDSKFLAFEVSGIAIEVGLGLYLFARDGDVPAPRFSLKLGSQEKPVTLMATPWGGTTHVGIVLSSREMIALQFGLGLIYRRSFDFGITKALVSGSLSATFTYIAPTSPDADAYAEIFVMMRLQGAASVGIASVHLSLTAIGKATETEWTFAATIHAGVHIAFFSVTVTFSFRHTESRDRQLQLLAGDDSGEAAWQSYRSAFAGVNGI